jgi:signal transduction histidine kinase
MLMHPHVSDREPPARSPIHDMSAFDLSLELLRTEHPRRYELWVLIAGITGTIGYVASCVAIVIDAGWDRLWRVANPYVVFGNLFALCLLRFAHRPRTAAVLMLSGLWIDMHLTLATQGGEFVVPGGMMGPVFVLACGLLLGGRVALIATGVTALAIPLAMSFAKPLPGAPSMFDPLLLVTVEGSLLATAVLLAAFLHSFARILSERHAADERTRALQEQLQQAQKLEAVGLLAGGVAHDFNNLLTAIGGFGSLVALSQDPKMREFGGEIVAAQQRGALLVRQLLTFARRDAVELRPIDIAQLLSAMGALLERLVGEKVRVLMEIGGPCPILGDAGQFEQIVLNLAANARDAMPNGGTLRLACDAGAEHVTLRVEDSGAGMPNEVKARIFEPFFTTKERAKGTGLGLSIVHGIVSDAGGTIEVDSAPNRGTCFTRRWPRSAMP